MSRRKQANPKAFKDANISEEPQKETSSNANMVVTNLDKNINATSSSLDRDSVNSDKTKEGEKSDTSDCEDEIDVEALSENEDNDVLQSSHLTHSPNTETSHQIVSPYKSQPKPIIINGKKLYRKFKLILVD